MFKTTINTSSKKQKRMSAVSVASSSHQLHYFPNHVFNLHKSLPSPQLPRKGQNANSSTIFFINYECSAKTSLRAAPECLNWRRTRVSFFPFFSTKEGDVQILKQELLEAIAPLDRGAEPTPDDQWRVDQRPKFLRPNGKIYQAISVDTLRAQNIETWPFFNQATANLVLLNTRRVAVNFDSFKIAGLIPILARGSGRGQLEITYLDEELRISRGNQGNLFILRMADPSYRPPL